MRKPVAAAAVACALLGVAALPAQQCDEEVVFQIREGTIEVSHNQTVYNCCSWIGFQVYQDGFGIDIVEQENYDPPGGCYCLCCFDIGVTVGGLDPGDYTVSITKRYESGETEVLGPWAVTVDGACDPFLITTYLPCVAASIQQEAEGTTWGIIKSLYR